MTIDTVRLAKVVYHLTADKGGVEEWVWEELADIAVGPAEERLVILGMVSVGVAILRKSDQFPADQFVSLKIETEAGPYIPAYQMIVATLNQDFQTAWAIATAAVNQGEERADEVMFCTALAVREIVIDYQENGGIVTEGSE